MRGSRPAQALRYKAIPHNSKCSILLAFELFGGAGLELLALACGLSYMLSGYHSLYSSQIFRTSKLFSEFLQPKSRT